MLVAKPKGQSVTFPMFWLFFFCLFLDKHRKQRCKSVFVGKQILAEQQQKAFDS